MTFNRGLYSQGTSMNSIKSTKEQADQFAKNFYSDSGRVGYHRIEEGKNIFRIAFAHEPGDSPYQPLRYCRIEMLVDEYDSDNNKTGNKTWNFRKYYIATQHGPKTPAKRPVINADPIEVYIEMLTKHLKAIHKSDETVKKIMSPVHGYWEGKTWSSGIRPDSKMICYAWNQNNELKLLELNRRWFETMEGISFDASKSGEAFDIFSHLDNGFPLIIEKKKIAEPGKRTKTEYTITKDEPDMMRRESWDEFFQRTRVTDDQIKTLMNAPSLKKQFVENYKKPHFHMVLEALKHFDEKHGFNFWGNAEFQETIEEIKAKVATLPDEEEQGQGEAPTEAPKGAYYPSKDEPTNMPEMGAGTSPSENGEVLPPVVPLPKMRRVVKEYVMENYDVEMPDLSKEELKRWYNIALSGGDLPIAEKASDKSDLPWELDENELTNEINKLKKG